MKEDGYLNGLISFLQKTPQKLGPFSDSHCPFDGRTSAPGPLMPTLAEGALAPEETMQKAAKRKKEIRALA